MPEVRLLLVDKLLIYRYMHACVTKRSEHFWAKQSSRREKRFSFQPNKIFYFVPMI